MVAAAATQTPRSILDWFHISTGTRHIEQMATYALVRGRLACLAVGPLRDDRQAAGDTLSRMVAKVPRYPAEGPSSCSLVVFTPSLVPRPIDTINGNPQLPTRRSSLSVQCYAYAAQQKAGLEGQTNQMLRWHQILRRYQTSTKLSKC